MGGNKEIPLTILFIVTIGIWSIMKWYQDKVHINSSLNKLIFLMHSISLHKRFGQFINQFECKLAPYFVSRNMKFYRINGRNVYFYNKTIIFIQVCFEMWLKNNQSLWSMPTLVFCCYFWHLFVDTLFYETYLKRRKKIYWNLISEMSSIFIWL